MTWSKVHTSTVVTPLTGATIADMKQYECWVEVFSWFSARGWTVTEAAGNLPGNQHNYWRLERTVTSYEGVIQTYLWNFRLASTTTSNTVAWLNGRNHSLEAAGPGTVSVESFSWPWPDGIAGGIEMWQSDQDSDSYLLIARYGSGLCIPRGFMPGANSLRASDPLSTSSAGCYTTVTLPVFVMDQLISGQGTKLEMAFGEISNTHGIRQTATPVITHGELSIHDEDVAYFKWRQADVSTLESPALSQKEWLPSISTFTNTRLIDGTYYIQLGDPTGYAVALLDCGAVNPNINA